MSMYDLSTTALRVDADAFRAQGCVVTEEVQEDPAEVALRAREKEIQAEAQKRAQREVEKIADAQRAYCARCTEQLEAFFEKLETDIRSQLTSLSVRIAEIIIGRELPDADMVRRVIQKVLEPITDCQGVRIRLAPADAKLLCGPRNTVEFDSKGLEWVTDEHLTPGDVMVESRNGIFDGRLQERLAQLASALETAGATRSPLRTPRRSYSLLDGKGTGYARGT